MINEKGRLSGKVAVITGGASGIGRTTAEKFVEEGAIVAVIDRSTGSFEEFENFLKENRGKIYPFCADITIEADVKQVMADIVSQLGRIDILVNCAGIFCEGDIRQTSYESWRKIMDVNLDGMFLCSKYAVEDMVKNGNGVVINIASEAGVSAIANQMAYNTSKAAVIMLTKCIAVDNALKGVRANCVCPGRVHTPLVQKLLDEAENTEELLAKLSHDRPMMRMGTSKDIAYACLNFATDEMEYATGSVLSIDGGYTL